MKILNSSFQRWAEDGRLYAILSAAGFSLKAVFVKLCYAAGSIDALTVLALRMGLALPLFLWLTWLSRNEKHGSLQKMDVVRILLLGMLGYYLSSLFDFYGLEYISTSLERLILYIYPTLVLIFQAIITLRRPGSRTIQAMLICYLGLAIAFVHDLNMIGPGTQVFKGAAWVFGSAVTYALYYLGTDALVQRLGSMRLAGLAGAASSLLVLVHYYGFSASVQLDAIPFAIWTYSGLMAFISTVLPVYWMSLAIKRIGATQAAAIGSLGPVLTIFAAWIMLDESLSIFQIAGLALVMFGVTRLKPRSKQAMNNSPKDKTTISTALKQETP